MGNGEAGPAPTREAGSTSGDAGSADATTPSDAAGGPSDGAADATAE
ncbi:MAG: hypothetical protein FWD17_02935 [Polyangiaceae bacterium]|nr:hypothetical protein [Polyangiaceae bacterium]